MDAVHCIHYHIALQCMQIAKYHNNVDLVQVHCWIGINEGKVSEQYRSHWTSSTIYIKNILTCRALSTSSDVTCKDLQAIDVPKEQWHRATASREGSMECQVPETAE